MKISTVEMLSSSARVFLRKDDNNFPVMSSISASRHHNVSPALSSSSSSASSLHHYSSSSAHTASSSSPAHPFQFTVQASVAMGDDEDEGDGHGFLRSVTSLHSTDTPSENDNSGRIDQSLLSGWKI